MQRPIFVLIFYVILQHMTYAQQKWVTPDPLLPNQASNQGSKLHSSPLSGITAATNLLENWDIRLQKMVAPAHASSVPFVVLDSIRRSNLALFSTHNPNELQGRSSDSLAPPAQGRNFRGNARDNSVPMDNSMAVSRNGFIVSGINTNIIFSAPDGKITFTRGLADFFQLLGLGSRMYDPRVIYDTEQNRFIFMCLHGSEPSNTFLCIAFSKTEDPNGEWNYYKIDGNPDGDENWFDYPNIALSAKELFISGLMRNTDGQWQYTVLYQIDKLAGYKGETVTWKHYNEIFDADGKPSFNLVPTPSGWSDLSPETMFFISNEELGGETYNLHYTTGSLTQNPSLRSIQSKGLKTLLAPYGRQNGTAAVLNTFDSRIWSAMYLNGTIHMGGHVATASGEVGLFYGRMDVQTGNVNADILSVPGKDLAYPSFTAFGNHPAEGTILINYLVSGPDQFPSQQQRVCKGFGNTFQWSEPNTLMQGTSQVDFLTGNLERWGDYTTASRRFGIDRTESWVTGCFGESRSYGTWLGQFLPEEEAAKDVLAEFVADKTTVPALQNVQFTDLTPYSPKAWFWQFEEGTPSQSTDANPIVTWNKNGAYDVTLIVTSDRGTDTLTKQDYIHISDPVVKPIADFTYDRDTLYKDDSVQFYESCSENTVTYKWTFQNGTPSSSTDKNPIVKYAKAGSHLVSLTAANIAGSNTKIKQKAVTVLERTKPVTRFSVNKPSIMAGEAIQFTDMTTGGPTQWSWTFEGGSPETSQEQNPIVRYENGGAFRVRLIAGNAVGTDTLEVAEYIRVTTSNTTEQNDPLADLNIFPNPCQEEDVHISFQVRKEGLYQIDLVGSQGNTIKILLNEKLKAGPYTLVFNGAMVVPGIYTLVISNGMIQAGVARLIRVP